MSIGQNIVSDGMNMSGKPASGKLWMEIQATVKSHTVSAKIQKFAEY